MRWYRGLRVSGYALCNVLIPLDVKEVLAQTGYDRTVFKRLPGWFMVWFLIALGLCCRDCYRQNDLPFEVTTRIPSVRSSLP